MVCAVWQWRGDGAAVAAMKNLDDCMRCPICSGLYSVAVSLPCSHSFCSACLRRSLGGHTCCSWRTMTLLFYVVFSPSLPLSLSPSLSHLSLSLPSLQQGFKQECPACRAPSELKDITKNAALQVVAAAFSAGRPAWLAALVGGVNGAVAPYPPAVKRTSSLSSPGPVPQHRLAVLCYTMMKEPQLRRLLSDHGLPTHGIKAALVGRHSAFVTLHNAELDSIEPRYGAGLLAVCRSGCLRVFVRSPDFLVSAAPFRTW